MAGRAAQRGEIWLMDLGMAAKVRPCLVLSVAYRDDERAVVTYVARTTALRGGRFEVPHQAALFKPGAFDGQNIGTVPTVRLVKFLARLPDAQLTEVESAVQRWMGFRH
jgi:mRNA interferase MazF